MVFQDSVWLIVGDIKGVPNKGISTRSIGSPLWGHCCLSLVASAFAGLGMSAWEDEHMKAGLKSPHGTCANRSLPNFERAADAWRR